MSDTQSNADSVDNASIEQLLTQQLALAEAHVQSEGSHFNIIAVGECFDGLSRVKKQQTVYKPLQQMIADNTIHAVSIKAYTPVEWEREKKFNLPS